MIPPPSVREAKATLRAFNKAQRKARPKVVVAARAFPGSDGQREPRERDPGFLQYLRRQPCDAVRMGSCSGPTHAAHIRFSDARHGVVNPGMGTKGHDRHANALCEFHHLHVQHRMNERAFWCVVGKDAYATAADHYARYQAASGQTPLASAPPDGGKT